MAEHAGPLPDAAGWWRPLLPVLRLLWRLVPRRLRNYLSRRFSDVKEKEQWGYAVWLTMGLVIAVPELTAALFDKVPWPTISGTVGYLEYRWSWVALIVVALIVFAALNAVRFPVSETGRMLAKQADARELRRTSGGRLTRAPADRAKDEYSFYFPAALLVVIVGSVLARVLWPDNEFLLGYVLYGSIGALFVVIPSARAYWRSREVPWPTLFWTVVKLERRLHIVTYVVGTGLVILLIHLVLYPWPSIIPDLQDLHQQNQQQLPKQKEVPPTPQTP